MAEHPRAVPSLRYLTALGSVALPVAIAVSAIVGWYARIPILTSAVRGGTSMRMTAAVATIALAMLLATRIAVRNRAARTAISALCFGVVATMSGASILHYTIFPNRLEAFLAGEDRASPHPMAVLTAVSLLALAVAMMSIRNPSASVARTSRLLAGFTALASVFVMLGYAYGVTEYYRTAEGRPWMALPTAIAIWALALGTAAAKSKEGWFAVIFRATTPAARVARRTIVVIALTMAILGWIRLAAQQAGIFDVTYGVALMITIQVAVTAALVTWGAKMLDEEFRRRLVREQELSAANERYLLVTRATQDATYDWDLIGERYFWNEAAQERFGFPAFEDAQAGSAWVEKLHPADVDDTRASFESACAGTETSWTAEYRLAGRDGWVDVLERCFIVRNETGVAVRAVGALTDVGRIRAAERILRSAHEELETLVQARTADLTSANVRLAAEIAKRKGVENVLRNERDFTATVMDTAAALTIVMDPEMKIVRFNRACEVLTGWTAHEVAGRIVSEFLVSESERAEVHAKFDALLAGEPRNQHENDWITRDGKRRRIAWMNSTIRDEHDFVTFVVSTGIDVTEERQAQAELLANRDELAVTAAALRRANEELEAFSYSVSHDLRAPLRAISGFSQALREDYGNDLHPTAVDYLSRIQNGAIRMTEIIDGLLTLSRISRAELMFEEVNLSQIAMETIDRIRELEPDRQVHVEIEQGVVARGDSRLLRIVLDNLLRNAWKFTGKRAEAKIRFGARSVDGTRQYFVADNGAGFDMQYASKLFVPFQRLHAPSDFAGSGIGLATVRRVIARHGGEVGATSDAAAGTTIFFTLGAHHDS